MYEVDIKSIILYDKHKHSFFKHLRKLRYTFSVSKIQDTTPPVITLNGDSYISLKRGTMYTELGATAVDDRDGNVSVHIIENIDENITGFYNVIYSAKDNAGNEANITRTVEVIPVLTSLKLTSEVMTLHVGDSMILNVLGTYDDGSTLDLTNDVQYSLTNSQIGEVNTNIFEGLMIGTTSLSASFDNVNSNIIDISVIEPIDTTNFDTTYFGNQYLKYISKDATKTKYDEKLFCMISGQILAEDYTPLAQVKVTIHDHPEYGSKMTDKNGHYAFATEGGTTLTIRYQKDGYTTVDRKVEAPLQDWAVVPEVVMLQEDIKVTTINFNSTNPQIHISTPVTDDRGTRSTTLIFNGVSQATVTAKDGTTRTLSNIDVRATEFKTPKSMPSDLPSTSAYTYCSDLTVDGVADDENITFNAPVIMYVENFLGFNVGEIVPVGYYDRKQAKWIGSDNGVVVKLLDTDGDGKVDSLDSDGDDQPNDLNNNGIMSDEVIGIADNPNYIPGVTYWRTSIKHFTPWDCNWPYGPPDDAEKPNDPDIGDPTPPNDCAISINSYVTAKTRVFHEEIPISGSNKTLSYSSKRTDGYQYVIDASIDTSNIPSSVIGAKVQLEVAGRIFQKEPNINELANLKFVWDGKDILGNNVSGDITAKLRVSYTYNMVYYRASSQFARAWANVGSNVLGIRGRATLDIWSEKVIDISVENKTTSNKIANGWVINDNHYYELTSKGILKGVNDQKYIGVYNGLLYAVDKEPSNRLHYISSFKNEYLALTVVYPSANISYSGDRVYLTKLSLINGKFTTLERTLLGSYSNFNFKLSYSNPPEYGYDTYAAYRGTIYEGLADRYFLEPSKNIVEMEQKIQEKIDLQIPYMIATNSHSGNLNRNDNYWTVFQADQVLLDKVKEFDLSNIVTDMSTMPQYAFLNLTEDNIVVFDGNLGYVYDIKSGLIEKIFDNNTKSIITWYTYDLSGRYINTIEDYFGNTLTLQKDSNDVPMQLTSSNGQQTYLNVDANGDLVSVTYEDGSSYSFTYDNSSLMTLEVDQNGNSFEHIFDTDGRIVEDIDAEGGAWKFTQTGSARSPQYNLIKPEGDTISNTDEKQLDNSTLSIKTLPTGDVITITTTEDQFTTNINENGKLQEIKYIEDPLNKHKVLASQATTQPSGLSLLVTYNITYDGTQTDIISKKTVISQNNKKSIFIQDYVNAKDTLTTAEGRVLTTLYNKENSLTTSMQNGTLIPTTYSYDTKGRVISETTGNRTISYTYDAKGNIATITNPQNETTSYLYDVTDRLIKITYPNNTSERYTYDANGNMIRFTTPTPSDFSFTYNGVDKRTSLTSPLNYATSYVYNKNRKLTAITRPSGITITNNYTNDRISSTIVPEGTITYDYVFDDQIASINMESESIEYNYDGDLLTSLVQTGVLNQTVSYTYNSDFKVTNSTYADVTTTYAYDNDGLLIKSGAFTITRDMNNGYVTQVSDGILTVNKEYNNYGELRAYRDNSFRYELQYDLNAKIIQKTQTVNSVTDTYNYSYDKKGRLIQVEKNGLVVESYTYDANSNRLSATLKGTVFNATYNQEDGIDTYGDNTYTYDRDGQLIQKITTEGITTYSYSSRGALTKVVTPTITIEYTLNPLGQRVAKKVDGVILEKYLWRDLTTLLAIYDKDDNLIERFEYADNRMPISMTKNSTKYYLHYDQVGTLRLITDENNNIIKEITYDSYGNILKDTNQNFTIPFGFAGGLHDRDTNLVHFGYREYDPHTGKWTAKDPIDFSGGDSNLYGYVLQDPVNFVDPEGRFGILGGIVAGGIGGAIVGLIDAGLNARCPSEGWHIFLVDTSSGILTGALATGGGFFGAMLGEVGGLGLNALSGLNGIPNSNPCNDTLWCP